MDELGFNKIAAAVLVTALGFMGLKEISHSAMHVTMPETPAYALELEIGPVDAGEVIELPFPQPEWIAAMDTERGAKVFKKCASCHNAESGGANGTGPNLWDVVGQTAGEHIPDFNYSSAMAQSGLVWDYETLDGYLEKPTRYLSGTAMNFVGLKKEGDRAAVIAYLRAKSDAPIAMPVPAASGITSEASAENMTDIGLDSVQNGAAVIVDAAQEGAEAVAEGAKDAGEVVQDGAESVIDAAGDLLGKAKDKVEEITKDEPKPEDTP